MTPGLTMPSASSDDRTAGDEQPDDDQGDRPSRDSGRQVGSGATSNVTSTSSASAALSSRIWPSRLAQSLHARSR